MTASPKVHRGERGTALLAVLWLSAALTAIAFTVANRVRSETERTATDVDAIKTYYLATGGIEQALLRIQWSMTIDPKYYQRTPHLIFRFPTGNADVEVIQETAKLNINTATPHELQALLGALGVIPARADVIVAAIVDWRTPSRAGFTDFDQKYLAINPSFHARHASFQEIDDLLLLQGMAPEIYYGEYTRDAQGNLFPHAGLRDCVSVFGSVGPIDPNTAQPAVMQAIGISPGSVAGIVALRKRVPITSMEQLAGFQDGGPGFARLAIVGGPVVTLRSTAQLNLNGVPSDLRRSVAATIKFFGFQNNPPYHILHWDDNSNRL